MGRNKIAVLCADDTLDILTGFAGFLRENGAETFTAGRLDARKAYDNIIDGGFNMIFIEDDLVHGFEGKGIKATTVPVIVFLKEHQPDEVIDEHVAKIGPVSFFNARDMDIPFMRTLLDGFMISPRWGDSKTLLEYESTIFCSRISAFSDIGRFFDEIVRYNLVKGEIPTETLNAMRISFESILYESLRFSLSRYSGRIIDASFSDAEDGVYFSVGFKTKKTSQDMLNDVFKIQSGGLALARQFADVVCVSTEEASGKREILAIVGKERKHPETRPFFMNLFNVAKIGDSLKDEAEKAESFEYVKMSELSQRTNLEIQSQMVILGADGNEIWDPESGSGQNELLMMKELQTDFDMIERQKRDLEYRVRELERRIKVGIARDMESSYKSFKEEQISSLQDRIKAKDGTLESAKHKERDLTIKISEMKKACIEKEKQNKVLMKKIEAMSEGSSDKSLQEKDMKINQLKNNEKEMAQRIGELTQKNYRLEKEKKMSEIQIEKLNTLIKNMSEKMKKYEKKYG